MGDLIDFDVYRAIMKDGGKARIKARRKRLGLDAGAVARSIDDLTMDHADPEMPCDVAP